MLDFVDAVPRSLAPACAAMEVGCALGCQRACGLCEASRFDAALVAFATPYATADRAALVSLWSMHYFTALIVPYLGALLCRDRVLPVAFDRIGLVIDDAGLAHFRLPSAGNRPFGENRLGELVNGHLVPFVGLCADRAGLAPRVFWANAAFVLDWTLSEMESCELMAAVRTEADALLAGRCGPAPAHGPCRKRGETSVRRVCCLRYRIAGVADCGGLCPRARRAI